MKKGILLLVMILNISLVQNPLATAADLTAKCVNVSLKSSQPLLRPLKDSEILYLVQYSNLCSSEVPSVEIALGIRSKSYPYDWRAITTGGKLGKVTANQRGEISIRLSYYSFSEVSETIFFYLKEEYPLENSTSIATTSINFSQNSGSSTTPATPTTSSTPIVSTPTATSSPKVATGKVKIGAACKKLNAKSWDGDNPIICKKNKKDKLVWSKFTPNSKAIPATSNSPSAEPTKSATPSVKLFNINITLQSGYALTKGQLGDVTSVSQRQQQCVTGYVYDPKLERALYRKKIGSSIRFESSGIILSLGSFDSYDMVGDVALPHSKYPNGQLAGTICLLKATLMNVPERSFYTLFIDNVRIADYALSDLVKGVSLSQLD